MTEVQYAPMPFDNYYTSRKHNSEPALNQISFPSHSRTDNYEPRSAPSSSTNSPRTSSASISTVSSCGSYFEGVSNQSSLDAYETEDAFSFPTYDDFNPMSNDDKPTFIHLEHSIGDDDPIPSPEPKSTSKPTTPSEPPPKATDDIVIKAEPSRHVDYLSHKWKEEDIWASWRYMVGKRNVYDNAARLENASWRTWMKAKNKLKTVSPEKLNWMKDYDVTWLYGPLSTAPEKSFNVSPSASPNEANNDRNASLLTGNVANTKKTILKKRSMSEVLLQRSISSSNLIQQATASIRSQQSQNHHRLSRPVLPSRAVSDYATYPFLSEVATTDVSTSEATSALESGLQSPSSCRKHIHFNDRVEQCIAVEVKEEDELDLETGLEDEGSSDDEGGLFLTMKARPKAGGRNNSRGSISEPQTIQKLPSTTLKSEVQPAELKQSTSSTNLSSLLFGGGSSTSGSSTSGLGNGTKFIYDDEEDDDMDLDWQPKAAFTNRRDSVSVARNRFDDSSFDDDFGFSECPPTPPSGNEGIFGRAVDAVNTARDIAHVFWNVGWANRR